MALKVNLHFHSGEDPRDFIPYSFYKGIDWAKKKGFDAIALTCHRQFVFTKEFGDYAKNRSILIIPGVELSISRWKHVIVLNCKKDIEKISTLEELRLYKKANPSIFILAPHPFFPTHTSLRKSLYKNIDLFDAIEQSWFWSRKTNFNEKARITALKYKKPFIATSDTHSLKYLDRAYALVDSQQNTVEAILESIKLGKFINISPPLKKRDFLRAEMLAFYSYFGGRIKDFKKFIR